MDLDTIAVVDLHKQMTAVIDRDECNGTVRDAAVTIACEAHAKMMASMGLVEEAEAFKTYRAVGEIVKVALLDHEKQLRRKHAEQN
jgi:hypothetical protein